MSQIQPFSIKNILIDKDIEIVDNAALYPLYNCSQSKIKVYFKTSSYAKKFRKAVRWDFGDDTIIEGSSAEHYYKMSGKYTITCTFYDLDRKPIENNFSVDIIVKEIIPLKLEIKQDTLNSNLSCSKISKLLSIESSFGADISTSPPIVIKRISNTEEKSYFDIKKDNFYHLKKYYTFLKENINYGYKKDFNESMITLTPNNFFVPKYTPIYAKFINDNDQVDIKLYALKESEHVKVPTTYKIYNPNALVNVNYKESDGDYYKIVEINHVGFLSDLPNGAEHCGWIGVENVWYKDDYIGEKELYFSHDTSYIKFYNNRNNIVYANIPPIGVKINVNSAEENTVYALSYNGLLTDVEIKENELSIEEHLLHNFYTDYKVEAYLGKFIKNDLLGDKVTWSLVKDDNLSLLPLNGVGCSVEEDENDKSMYYKHYYITPHAAGFTLNVGDLTHKNTKLLSLSSIRIPQKKYEIISFDKMLEAYMPHPMFDDKDLIKSFFKQIFKTDYLFDTINNKGFDFFDDLVNHKTCYINNLQSILEMFDKPEYTYNISSFDKINELKELCRILSMQFSELMGQFEIKEENIKVSGDYKGSCVGDRILPSDIIVCNSEYKIVGIIRNDKFTPTLIQTSNVILVDDFTKESRLVSFEGIQSHIRYDKEDEIKYYYPKYYYCLNDYDYKWGWNLRLNTENRINMGSVIDSSYSIYLYRPEGVVYDRIYNYLDKDTIPYSETTSQTYITYDEWNKDFGFTYDCLMKILLYKLGLN